MDKNKIKKLQKEEEKILSRLLNKAVRKAPEEDKISPPDNGN